MNKFTFEDIVLSKHGLLRGPFGGDLKKEIFVSKSKDTYKVYEQGVVLQSDAKIGRYYISKEYFDEKMYRFEVKPKDFLISCSGVNYGAIYQLGQDIEPGVINQALLRIRLNNDIIDDDYFFYLFKHHIVNMIVGKKGDSTIPNFPPISVIKKLSFSLPDLSLQKSVGSLLKKIDTKIQLNNQINEELESIAKTLYDYWFVQFDFPDKDDKPYKSNKGKMVWNGKLKREIPEDWEVGDLSDIANITMGQSPPGESYNKNGKGIIFFQGCTDFGHRFPTIRQYTTKPTRFAKSGDILLSVRAPVGTLNIAIDDCCIGRGLAALNSKNNSSAYLYGVIKNLKQIFDRRNTDGTTFGAITKDDLFSLKIIKPKMDVLQQYEKIIHPTIQKQNILELENQKLSDLRNWLLPMLMNGQVKIVKKDNNSKSVNKSSESTLHEIPAL